MRSILLIDHGSVKPEANHMVSCMANLLQHMVGDGILVRHAHMELAEPSIAEGFADCVRNGATEVIAFPYMLSPGKHVTREEACQCWDAEGRVGSCGAACAAQAATVGSAK